MKEGCLGTGWFVVVALTISCQSILDAPPVTGGAPETVSQVEFPLVQIVHRRARGDDGEFIASAARELVDAAFVEWADEEFPIDVIEDLGLPDGVLRVIVPVPAGVIANAFLDRLQIAFEDRARFEILNWPVPRTESGVRARYLAVVVPSWKEGKVLGGARQAADRLGRIDAAAPLLVLADLREPQVDGVPWRADMVLLGSATAVECASHYMLAAHSSRKIPNLDVASATCGADLGSLPWKRRSLSR